MNGNLDLVTPDGVVEGWCWNEEAPGERVTVAVQVNGVEVGRVIASHYREDLHKAGIGDGHHFFRFVMPEGSLRRNRNQVVSLAAVDTGEAVGEPHTLNSEWTLTFDERLSELETRNELLQGAVTELERTLGRDGGQGELFAVVGAFFDRLSRDLARGARPTPEQQMGETVRALLHTHPPLTFPMAKTTTVSVLVEAANPLDQVYACLAAIRSASTGIGVRVTVLDTGAFDEAALIPSLTRGVRYIRTVADLVSEWLDVERGEDSPVLVSLSSQVEVDKSFFAEILNWFASHGDAGAVGGCVAREDGAIQHAGLVLARGRLDDVAGAMGETGPVHALSHHAAAFRRTAMQAAGGVDPIFGDDLGAAVIDLCFRMRKAGWSITSHPRAVVGWPPNATLPWTAPAAAGASRTGTLLRQRWLSRAEDDQPTTKAR